MENLINAKEITSKTISGVEQETIDQLNSKGYIAGNNGEMESYFSGIDGKIHTNPIQKLEVNGNIEGDWQKIITVHIYENYIDPGSDFYYYTVKVTED